MTLVSNLKGGNDFVGQGRPKPTPGKNTLYKKGHVSNSASMTSVQQGKQKALPEGHASIAESSAPISNEGACHVGRKTNNIQRI